MKLVTTIIVLLLFCSCTHNLVITQEIRACEDPSHFQINTYVNEGICKILYSSNSWEDSHLTCLTHTQVDSAMKAEYKKAELFITNYNKLKK